MDFGLVAQTNPPAMGRRRVGEARRGRGLHALLDVRLVRPVARTVRHLLPDPRRYVAHQGRTDGDQSVTRDWTVTASLFATLNEMFGPRTICGIGRGDSALRVTGRSPASLETLASASDVIKELVEGREVDAE